jgi:hypothetical protein
MEKNMEKDNNEKNEYTEKEKKLMKELSRVSKEIFDILKKQ